MRENMGLYRGKQTDTGEWVEGWYCKAPYGRWPLRDTIIPSVEDEAGHLVHVEINPETVGQYTGRDDKNGRKMFEHDIVRFDRGTFVVMFADCRMGFCFSGLHGRGCVPGFSMAHWEHVEVIGNIHDDPELLEGGAAQ